MKKQILLISSVFITGLLNAQVGINTETPKATLDVVASADMVDGIIAPRLTGDDIKGKDSLYGEEQTGAIVYATEAVTGTPEGKTINVTAEGYYYFDGLVWTKFSGGASGLEPWKIQNTTTDATENDDNIYQQGKVAVGFESTDAVTGKQFEVKGDMKSEFVDTDDYVYNFETAAPNSLDPSTKDILMSVANNQDLSAATNFSVLGANKSAVMFQTHDNTTSNQKAAVVAAFTVADGGAVGLATAASEGGKNAEFTGSTWTETVEAQIRTAQEIEGNEINMDVMIRPKSGITFKHSGVTDYGAYTFPKNSPTEGQVLIGSATSGTTTTGRQLEWKSIADIAPEPWKIQNTTTPATENDDNIYQQGKVAVGFESTDAVSGKQLEVKGDFNAEYFEDTEGAYHQMVTNADYMGAGVLKVSGISVSDKSNVIENFMTDTPTYQTGVLARKGNASLSSTNYLGGSMTDANSAGYQAQSDDTQSVFFAATQNAGNQLTQVLGNSKRNGVNYLLMESVNTANNMSRIVLGDQNTANGQSQIAFQFQSATTQANYALPTTNGLPGQVLTTPGGTYTTTPKQLEWKDLQDAVVLKSPGGNCFKITVNDSGALSTTPTTCL